MTGSSGTVGGTVEKIAIISPLDYLYPSNGIADPETAPPAVDGAMAYGKYDVEKEAFYLTTEDGISITPFQQVFQRFGIEL